MEQTECFETSAYKIQTPGNYPEENIQHSQHGESLKSRVHILFYFVIFYFILFILFYFILFYFILFYFILFHFISFCFILFYFTSILFLYKIKYL
jgi:hypothetical protein